MGRHKINSEEGYIMETITIVLISIAVVLIAIAIGLTVVLDYRVKKYMREMSSYHEQDGIKWN